MSYPFPSTLTEDQIAFLARVDPMMLSEYQRLREFEFIEKEREEYEDSLIAFFERAWREIDPAPFEYGWHLDAGAEQLEALAQGDVRDIIFNWPPRPVSEEALVHCRERGLVPLKRIEVGDFVLTHRRRWRRVEAIHLQGELECLRVRTRRGRELDAAPDHPFLTPDGWVDAWTLRPDDVVGIVPGRASGRAHMKEEEARLLGYLIGDGSVNGTPNVTATSPAVAQDVAACANALGFVPIHRAYAYGAPAVAITAGTRKIHHSVGLKGNHQKGERHQKGYKGPVRQWLAKHDLEGKTSYTKKVPDAILEGDDSIVRAFLGAYWSCDGFVSSKGAKRDGTERDDLTLGCDSVSLELLTGIQQLLTRLGIATIIRTKIANLKTKRQGDTYTSYSLTISDQDNAARFARQIVMAHEKDDKLRKARRRRFDFDHDIWGESIISNEKVGKKPCRCLTVADDHSFVANGFAVKNTGKSNLMICFQAWIWAQPPERQMPLMGPHVSFLCVSYGATLAEVHATKARRLIMGDWYQGLWGDRVKIREDQQSRADFGNVAGGERISNSIEGGILGRGGLIQLIDDPHKLDGVESQLERERTIRALKEGLSTRITDPRIFARILTMQRLHRADATDYALENWRRDLRHIKFPMRFEADMASPADRRRYDGQLLWPKVWTEEAVAAREVELGPYASAGQLQQRPVPREGGIIADDDWELWPEFIPSPSDMTTLADGSAYVPLPPVSHVVLSLDTALSERESADWNACVIVGVWHRPRRLVTIVGSDDQIDDGEQPRAIVMGGWRRRCKLNDDTLGKDGRPLGLVQLVADTCRRFPVDRIIIENKTRGLDVKNELERQFSGDGFNIQLFDPRKHGDKVARLHSVQPLFSQRLIYMPGNCVLAKDHYGNETVDVREFTWARQIVDEISSVPRGTHDDFADACSQALLVLREEGLLTLTQEYVRQQVAVRMMKRKPDRIRNSYGV